MTKSAAIARARRNYKYDHKTRYVVYDDTLDRLPDDSYFVADEFDLATFFDNDHNSENVVYCTDED